MSRYAPGAHVPLGKLLVLAVEPPTDARCFNVVIAVVSGGRRAVHRHGAPRDGPAPHYPVPTGKRVLVEPVQARI